MNAITPVVFILALVCPVAAQAEVSSTATLPEQLQKQTKSLNPTYLVFLSEQEATQDVPLLVYLHGAGGVGDDIGKIRGQASQVWKGIERFKKGPCIVVAPQCNRKVRDGGGWIPEDLNVLLAHLKATLPVDDKRIYLTGNSMGGYGTWAWAGHSPEYFAAVAPVSGGIGPGGPKDVTPDLDKWAANLAKIPVYAFAGGKDRVVPAERSQRMITAIKTAGGEQARVKIYPNEGHGAGRIAYSNVEFYQWLFSKKRE